MAKSFEFPSTFESWKPDDIEQKVWEEKGGRLVQSLKGFEEQGPVDCQWGSKPWRREAQRRADSPERDVLCSLHWFVTLRVSSTPRPSLKEIIMSTHLIMFIHRNEGELYSQAQGKERVQTEGQHERGWIRATINSLYRLFNAENLISSSLYTSAEQDILNCMVNLAEGSVLSLVSKLKDEDTGTNTRWRLYEPLESIIESTKTPTPHVLVGNAMTPTAEREEDFNRWYNQEHILMLSRAPTWIHSSRYLLIDSNHEVPNYLALHKWGNRNAFESPQYEIATATPWKFQVVDNVIARERHVYAYVGEVHVAS